MTPTAAAFPPPPEAGGAAVLPSGHILSLEVADEPAEHRRGLMGRPALPPDRGMLFLFPYESIRSFHMEGCLVPLDILWIDASQRIVHIERRLPPCEASEERPCPSWAPQVPARYVLELRAGGADALGLSVGSLVLLDLGGGARR